MQAVDREGGFGSHLSPDRGDGCGLDLARIGAGDLLTLPLSDTDVTARFDLAHLRAVSDATEGDGRLRKLRSNTTHVDLILSTLRWDDTVREHARGRATADRDLRIRFPVEARQRSALRPAPYTGREVRRR